MTEEKKKKIGDRVENEEVKEDDYEEAKGKVEQEAVGRKGRRGSKRKRWSRRMKRTRRKERRNRGGG